MILKSNKNSRAVPAAPIEDAGVSKGRLLKASEKFYGKTEANPFKDDRYLHAGYRTARGNVDALYSLQNFEYDFAETNRIIDTEALVAAIFRKKKALIVRDGPMLKSKSERNADYVQKRLSEMEYVSGVLFPELLEAIVESLVSYNNVFLLKHRNEFSSSGLFRDGETPISCLYLLSPTRLAPILNVNKEVVAYRYSNLGKNQPPLIIRKEDIYHIYTDKKIDLAVGTPPLEAVKGDIKSLRQIEASIENLIYKHASPLVHVKVGTDKYPAGRLQDGTNEIDYYNSLVQQMEDEGGLTTGHRVDVSLIGAESHALRAEGSLLYFKNRVISGLKASLLDLGEADSISTAGANAVSKVLKQDVEAYQKVLEKFFTHRFFTDLLLESKWYVDKARLLKDEEVELTLHTPDIEDRIRTESHMANLVRFGLMSPEEFSKETGRTLPPLPPPEALQTNIHAAASNGAFSSIASPANQHTDKEYEVLDSLITAPEGKRLAKTFIYVQDSLDGIVSPSQAEDLALKLNAHIKRCHSLQLERGVINMSLKSLIAQELVGMED